MRSATLSRKGPSPESGPRRDEPRRGALVTLLLLSSMTVMAGATISPTLPAIGRFFGDAPRADLAVRLVLTLPALFTAVGAPCAGWFIDRYGRRRLLFASVALYAVSGGSGLLARSLPELLLGRACLGLAVGGILTTATTLIADYYSGARRSQVLGYQSAFMGLGGVLFVTLGGALTDVGWRAPFAVYLLAFLYLPLVFRHLVEPGATAGPAAGRLPDHPQFHPGSLALLYLLGFLGMIVFFALPVQLPFFLEQIADLPGSRVGLALGLMTGTASISSLLYARIRRRLGFIHVFALLFVLQGSGYLALARATGFGETLPALVMAGAGAGLLVPNLQLWASQLAPEAHRGRILGGLGLSLFLGQFSSPLVTQALAGERGYPAMYGALALFQLLLAATFLLGTLFPRPRRPA